MDAYFRGDPDVRDTRGQQVLEFYFSSTGKLKCRKTRERVTPSTVLSSYGTQGRATELLRAMFNVLPPRAYPKPVGLVRSFVEWTTRDENAVVLDYFAGTGTTAEATISACREDGIRRKVVLVDFDDQFDSLIVPRVAKSTYTPNWADGQPGELPEGEAEDRSPRVAKILRLEHYEDSIANLDVYRPAGLGDMFERAAQESAALLSVDRLQRPFDYRITVLSEEGPVEHVVDLCETFNLAYGIHVETIRVWTNPADHDRKYRAVSGRKDGRRVLVLWRDMGELDPSVERAFLEERIEPDAYDDILINGDGAVPADGGRPPVRSLDPIFKQIVEQDQR
jgi:adenine-specific DNA-methyltransferase